MSVCAVMIEAAAPQPFGDEQTHMPYRAIPLKLWRADLLKSESDGNHTGLVYHATYTKASVVILSPLTP